VKKLFVKLKLRAMSKCCFELNKSLFNIDGGGGCENYEEVANFAALPATGDTNTTYKTLDDNKIFIWDGSQYVELVEESAPIGATLMKTGQTVSYRTGDDGDIEAGREVDFFTLSANNPFGNNKRFTGITGGYQIGGVNYNKDGGTTTAALAFPHDIVIDWSTTKSDGTKVLGWSRLYNGNNNWNNNIDNALVYTISTYTTGWRLPNIIELTSIVSYSSVPSLSLNYEPFNLSISGYYDSRTSYRVAAAAASTRYVLNNLTGQFDLNNKANNAASIRCRLFSITGTTLT
jgi:hypothetical protein